MKAPLLATAENGMIILVGVLIGINMAIISVVSEWASDLKQGYCAGGWWLNKKFCCWEEMDPAGPGNAVPKGIAAVAAAAAGNMNVTSIAAATQTATQMSLRAVEPTLPSSTCTDWVEWGSWTLPSWCAYVAFSALLAFTSAALVRHYAPTAAGSGISEIKCVIAGFNIQNFLSNWTLVIKSLGLPLAIASGLSVGKEGPAVHVACCMGMAVTGVLRWLVPSHSKLREVLIASSAAGVAVAFGSPIGGVLFALEEMTTSFPSQTMWRTFLCALASTVALSFMNPFRTGKLVLFQVEYNREWHYFEIVFFLLIGILGGLYGEYVLRFNLQVQRFRKKFLAHYGVQEAVILASMTAMICYFNRFLRLDMTETLELLFQQCDGASDDEVLCQSRMQWSMASALLIATVLRFVLVILSYGCKVPAGIFIPSMAVGATFGRMVGILVKALQTAFPSWNVFSSCTPDAPCITPGTYAMLGAAAALAGVTRITVAVVVIMFELTGALTYILPIMLVVGTAKLVADLNGKGGVADRSIKFNGYPFLDPEDHTFGINVGSMMTTKTDVLFADGMPYKEVDSIVTQGTYRGFPVVASAQNRTVLGYMERAQLRFAIRQAQATNTLHTESMCTFQPKSTDVYALTSAQVNTDSQFLPEWLSSNPSPLDVTEEGMEAETGPVDLGAWVDPAPLIVQPQLDLEVVSDMFKRLGPRVILVCSNGVLEGIVTIKDLLRHIARQEREERNHTGASDISMDARADTGFVVGTGMLEEALENLWHKACAWASRFSWGERYTQAPAHVPLTSVTTIYADR